LEERAHADPAQGRVIVVVADRSDDDDVVDGGSRRYYRLPWGIAGFYALAFAGGVATLAAVWAERGGGFDVGDAEVRGCGIMSIDRPPHHRSRVHKKNPST
jgi:hypothetical protein